MPNVATHPFAAPFEAPAASCSAAACLRQGMRQARELRRFVYRGGHRAPVSQGPPFAVRIATSRHSRVELSFDGVQLTRVQQSSAGDHRAAAVGFAGDQEAGGVRFDT